MSNDSPSSGLWRDTFAARLPRVKAGADDGIRTRDLRFTKPLLYQLSYVGKRGQTLHRGNSVAIALNGLAPSLARARDEIVERSRQNECLTNFPQRDAFRSVAERGLKAFDGFPEWLETEPERLMMHGHDKSRAGGVCHFNRLFRCAV